MHGISKIDVPDLLGTIHPFLRTNQSLLSSFKSDLSSLAEDKQARKIFVFALINIVCTIVLLIWCITTNSMALTAYTYLTIFDFFKIMTCLITLWVKNQKPSPIYSFGFERFEVLFVFASTVLAQLGSLFIAKESFERILDQPDVHTGRILFGMIFAWLFHTVVLYGLDNPAFNHVVDASSSSWLQEHVSDMCECLCHYVPGLSKLLLPRINPFSLISYAGAFSLGITYVLIDVYSYTTFDTWAAIGIAIMTCCTMFPMSAYTGKILLQTTPAHLIGQLDKCLREASTLDGVLEFRHEHFWTVSFGKLAGSVHVRVRRDADEQMVLAHVYNRLSNIVSILNVQIFKDDWSRSNAFILNSDLASSILKGDNITRYSLPSNINNVSLPSSNTLTFNSSVLGNLNFNSNNSYNNLQNLNSNSFINNFNINTLSSQQHQFNYSPVFPANYMSNLAGLQSINIPSNPNSKLNFSPNSEALQTYLGINTGSLPKVVDNNLLSSNIIQESSSNKNKYGQFLNESSQFNPNNISSISTSNYIELINDENFNRVSNSSNNVSLLNSNEFVSSFLVGRNLQTSNLIDTNINNMNFPDKKLINVNNLDTRTLRDSNIGYVLPNIYQNNDHSLNIGGNSLGLSLLEDRFSQAYNKKE